MLARVALTMFLLSPLILSAQNTPKKTATIRFFAPVNEQSVNTLLHTIDEKLKTGTERIVLLISSPGGNVFYGMSAYNYLKGIPIEVVTHNFGQVDSIAALIYCAGSKRYSVPQGEFLLHGISVTLPGGGLTLEQAALGEQLQQMENQVDSISKVIAASTGHKVDEVRTMINSRTVLGAEDARKFGLVQEIKSELIPAGSEEVIAIQTADTIHGPRFWSDIGFGESSIPTFISSVGPFVSAITMQAIPLSSRRDPKSPLP